MHVENNLTQSTVSAIILPFINVQSIGNANLNGEELVTDHTDCNGNLVIYRKKGTQDLYIHMHKDKKRGAS